MLTVDLFSVYLVSCVDTVICYIEVYFIFGLPDYVPYIEEFAKWRFVISRFYSIHFTVILARRRGVGEGREGNSCDADKPLDFENLRSPANGARDWLG